MFILTAGFLFFPLSSSRAGIIPIVNGGFETDDTYTGWPSTTGIWSYDVTDTVSAEQGVEPYEGERMVRFINTLQSGPGAEYSELFQVFEVAGSVIEDDIASGTFFMTVEYFCNRVPGDEETDTEFTLDVYGYNTESYPPDWHSGFVFHEKTSIITDGDPETWERITLVTSTLPVSVTYLSIDIAVHENVSPDDSPELEGHYADCVRAYFGSVGTGESSWGEIKSFFRN